jgi:signal transduction histidine kinase
VAFGLIAADVAGQVSVGTASGITATFLGGQASGILAALWVWAWRPGTRMGPLIIAWPLGWIVPDLMFTNERLQAQLRAQLAELRDSRARIVRTADAERRRLERDLHDGAQQRLLGVGLGLRLLRGQLSGDSATLELVDETESEVQQALAELRELARGIHPAVLTDQGLGAALRTLAARASIPVQADESGERLPAHVETAAYFVAAEALANVARYARASKARVSVERRNGDAIVEIVDDGIGGADPDNGGTGLRGLADRVGALDGHLEIRSPAGGGTTLRAVFPCGT